MTILADSLVWIEYFNGRATPETDALDDELGREPVLIESHASHNFESRRNPAGKRGKKKTGRSDKI